MKCIFCRKLFKPKRNGHKLCSYRCRYCYWNSLKPRVSYVKRRCKLCHCWFKPKHKNAQYCSTYCIVKASRKQSRVTKKQKAILYLGGRCQKCGYHKCLDALEFHHRNPKRKKENIGNWYMWKWSKLKHELNKCDLLCSNCHRELHWKINNELR